MMTRSGILSFSIENIMGKNEDYGSRDMLLLKNWSSYPCNCIGAFFQNHNMSGSCLIGSSYLRAACLISDHQKHFSLLLITFVPCVLLFCELNGVSPGRRLSRKSVGYRPNQIILPPRQGSVPRNQDPQNSQMGYSANILFLGTYPSGKRIIGEV